VFMLISSTKINRCFISGFFKIYISKLKENMKCNN
jgi:hypothetical protein